MDLTSTVIERPLLQLAVARAESFPEGVADAFARVEGSLPTLRGRKFYGVAREGPQGVEYFAGVAIADETEAAVLGLPSMVVAAGPWARSRLAGGADSVASIPSVVDGLIARHGMDPSRPVLEFYKSRDQLEVLVPVLARADAGGADKGPRKETQ